MKYALYVVPSVLILVLVGAITAVNLGVFHSYFEQKLSEASGGQVTLGSTYLIPKWPLALRIGESHVALKNMDVRWSSATASLASLTPPWHVRVFLDHPKLEMLEAKVGEPAPEAGAKGASAGGQNGSPPLNLEFEIVGGEVTAPSVHLTELEIKFAQKEFMHSVAGLHVKSLVEVAGETTLPLTLEAEDDALTLSPELVKTESMRLHFAGLTAQIQGETHVTSGEHHWKVALNAPDLKTLPKPPQVTAQGLSDWSGSLDLHLEIAKSGEVAAWAVAGDVKARDVRARMAIHHDKLKVEGPLALDLDAQFAWANSAAVVRSLNGSVELGASAISFEGILNKNPGVPFNLKIQASGDQDRVTLQTLQLQFWNVVARASGQVSGKAPYVAKLSVEVPSLSLAGADVVFPPLAKSPVQGELGLNLKFEGRLADPKLAHVVVDTLKLKNFAAVVDYDKPGMIKLRGPVMASVEGRAEVNQSEAKRVDLRGHVDLKGVALAAGPLRKEAKQLLTADFQVRNQLTAVIIQNLSVASFAGLVKLSGTADTAKNSKVDLKIELQNLNLNELRMALPEYRDKIPKGTTSGRIGVKGRPLSDKPWFDWPLDLDGRVQVHIPDYAIEPAPQGAEPSPAPKSGSKPKQESAAFLPKGYLTEHLQFQYQIEVDTVRKDKLTIEGVHLDGQIAHARLRGSAALKKIFSGDVQLTGLDVPLTDPRPTVRGFLKWHELVIQDALGFVKPEYREFATGRSEGSTEFETVLPSDAQFMQFLKAKGDLKAEPVVLNSVKVGQVVNDLVKQVPMIKMQPMKVEPLKGYVRSKFDLRDQVAQIDGFTAHDNGGSELQLKGKVMLTNMQGDLAGTFLWASPSVKGCLLEGNSDSSGRLAVPVAIKGDLMHPGIGTLSDTISKLGTKALACEQKKLVDQIQKEGTKKLEEEGKKILKGLFGN